MTTAPPAVGISPGATPPAAAGLGRYTKSSTAPPPAADGRDGVRAVRAQRYELLSTARRVLSAAGQAAGLRWGHDLHRTAKCSWVRTSDVGVHRHRATGSAFYSGLTVCGSVWSCPVCAAKIQERRREEVAQGVQWAYEQGLQPVLVTLTFPHRAWHSLRQLLEQQAQALACLRKGDAWTRHKKRMGYQGLIRALEVTHGEHGWHPHTHELWLVGAHVQAEDLRALVLARWEAACIEVGLLDPSDRGQVAAFRRHAVDVKGWCSAGEYLAKQDDSKHWGVDRELAKASTKAGKRTGRHPFGLLTLAGDGDSRAAALYVEYATTMRKTRTRQLYFSPGLKGRVGIGELSDEEIAKERRERADLLGQLDADDWRLVRDAGARAQVLDAAETGGWPAVRALLERLTLAEIDRIERVLATTPAPAPCRLAELLSAALAEHRALNPPPWERCGYGAQPHGEPRLSG